MVVDFYQQRQIQEDAERLQRSQSKAPSVLMKSLVEKLKNDLAEKEKKQKVAMNVDDYDGDGGGSDGSGGDGDGGDDGNSGRGRDGEKAEGGYERADEGGGGVGEIPSVNEKNIFGEFQLKIKIMPRWKVRWKLKIRFAQIMGKLQFKVEI